MGSQFANGDAKRRIPLLEEGVKTSAPRSGDTTEHVSDATGSQKSSKTSVEPHAKPSTIAATIFSPAIITSLLLIFGGCCSNVYALESIVKLSPASGTLVTSLQFVLTAVFTFPSQLTTRSTTGGSKNTSLIPRLRRRAIPLYKWLIYTAFFLTVNMLNNFAFSYRISVPLHIIVRSASPVTSMLVGYLLAGRRYTRRQVFAVLLLFAGVVLAALSDAHGKNTHGSVIANHSGNSVGGMIQAFKSTLTNSDLADQLPGFVLLLSALILAAIMGVYTDRIYDQHGRSVQVTNENLFYSHVLSLPWFAFQKSTLRSEFTNLTRNADLVQPSQLASSLVVYIATRFPKLVLSLPSSFLILANPSFVTVLGLLLLNALTQIVCITGVNRLSTETTSLTVTIVLNIRKLVSLLMSIWLFGTHLSTGVVVGATMVFIGGGLYGLGGGKKTTPKRKVG